MIRIHETTRVLPFFPPVPLTRLPLLYHREHLFPYTSYGDTRATAGSRALRMVVLENDFLRVEVAPELGLQIENAVRGVHGVHEPLRIRARQSGNHTFVDVVAHVRRNMPMHESHAVADKIEEAVRACVSNVDVVVHLEPTGQHRSTHE